MIRIVPTRTFILDKIKTADAEKYLRTVAAYAGQLDPASLEGRGIEPLKGLSPFCLVSYAGFAKEQALKGSDQRLMRADHLWDFFCGGKSYRSEDEAEEKAVKIFEEITDPLFNAGEYYTDDEIGTVGLFSLEDRNLVLAAPGVAVYHVVYRLHFA